LDDFYAELKDQATRLRRDDFVGWLKHPTLLLDFVDEQRPDPDAGAPLATIESTVLFQQGSAVSSSADGDEGVSDSRGARLLAKNGRGLEMAEELTLGRSSDCDIVIDHYSISKVHAYITREPNGSFTIRDAGSRNGITINGSRVGAQQTAKLKPDDVIRIGAVMARLIYPRPLYGLLTDKPSARSALSYLRDRTFAKFWAGQGLALMADSLFRLVITWWVVANTGSGQILTGIAVFQIVPMMLTLLGGGILVDRMARSRVLLLGVGLKGCALAFVAFALHYHSLHVWHLFAVSTVLGIGDAFFMPALAAIVPELVRREDLRGANALVTLSSHVANLAGPAIGTALVAFGGHALAVSIITIFFAVSSLFILRLPAFKQRYGGRDGRPAAGGLREAAAFMFGEPRLWMTSLTLAICGGIGIVAATVLLPLLIKDSLHSNIGNLGPVTSVYWIGALLGTLWMGKKIFKREFAGYAAAPIIALCFFAAGLPITIYGLAAVWLVRGFASNVLSLTWVGTMQRLAPREMLGRIASIDGFLAATLALGTFVVAGALVDAVRTDVLFLVAGAVALVMPVLAYANRRFRHFERVSHTELD
jgi:MFS family permease